MRPQRRLGKMRPTCMGIEERRPELQGNPCPVQDIQGLGIQGLSGAALAEPGGDQLGPRHGPTVNGRRVAGIADSTTDLRLVNKLAVPHGRESKALPAAARASRQAEGAKQLSACANCWKRDQALISLDKPVGRQ